MPELPEVETIARGLTNNLVNKQIEPITVLFVRGNGDFHEWSVILTNENGGLRIIFETRFYGNLISPGSM